MNRVHPLLALAAAILPALAVAQANPMEQMERPDTSRQVVFVTGSTDGLGREVALRVAATGAHVIVHGRNRERGEAVVAEIERSGSGSARFYAADLAELDQVRQLGQHILRDYDRLDVLVNNAGIWLRGNDERQLSTDGHELQLAVNYLSGFLLTHTLLPLLEQSVPSRIVNVSSAAQVPLDFDDVMLARSYTGARGYAQSKLAQVMFTFDLAREVEGKGIIVTALHPATLMNTSMVEAAGVAPRATVDEGADAVMQLIAGDVENGAYYDGLEPARANAQAYDAEARARLNEIALRLTGLADR